ncbi:MAG: Tfp pilus assembly protein PilV, partial [Planctomycetota bacterium]
MKCLSSTVRRGRAGFTLIEVLLAAGLLVAGMSMILGVFNFGSAM